MDLIKVLKKEIRDVEVVQKENIDSVFEEELNDIYHYLNAELRSFETAKPLSSLPQLRQKAHKYGYKIGNFKKWWKNRQTEKAIKK